MPVYFPSSGGGGGSSSAPPFSVVQMIGANAVAGVATLQQSPTAGNTLLILTGCDSSDAPTAPSGFSALFTPKSQSSFAQVAGYIKTAAGTESTVTIGGVSGTNSPTVALLEIAGTHTLDAAATSGVSPAKTTAQISPPSITAASGSMVFVAASYPPSAAFANRDALIGGNWISLQVFATNQGARQLSLFLYNGQGAGASLQPPIFSTSNLFNTSTGIAIATFSIK